MSDKERLELLMIYSGIVAFRFHPGVKSVVSYKECMVEACTAYHEFRAVCAAREALWPG